MATSIKLFQFIQNIHQIIGIYPSVMNQKLCAINSRNATLIIFLTQFILTMVAFLVFEAKSVFDFGFGFFTLISTINIFVVYLLLIWQFENTVEFIDNCEAFIKKSK